MESNRYHCCASCINFKAEKTSQGMRYECVRLGYETKPIYRFDCWEPKPQVLKLMKKEDQV
jgi:CO dehydrogenase/acetyl-CoA synthase delta subunit